MSRHSYRRKRRLPVSSGSTRVEPMEGSYARGPSAQGKASSDTAGVLGMYSSRIEVERTQPRDDFARSVSPWPDHEHARCRETGRRSSHRRAESKRLLLCSEVGCSAKELTNVPKQQDDRRTRDERPKGSSSAGIRGYREPGRRGRADGQRDQHRERRVLIATVVRLVAHHRPTIHCGLRAPKDDGGAFG